MKLFFVIALSLLVNLHSYSANENIIDPRNRDNGERKMHALKSELAAISSQNQLLNKQKEEIDKKISVSQEELLKNFNDEEQNNVSDDFHAYLQEQRLTKLTPCKVIIRQDESSDNEELKEVLQYEIPLSDNEPYKAKLKEVQGLAQKKTDLLEEIRKIKALKALLKKAIFTTAEEAGNATTHKIPQTMIKEAMLQEAFPHGQFNKQKRGNGQDLIMSYTNKPKMSSEKAIERINKINLTQDVKIKSSYYQEFTAKNLQLKMNKQINSLALKSFNQASKIMKTIKETREKTEGKRHAMLNEMKKFIPSFILVKQAIEITKTINPYNAPVNKNKIIGDWQIHNITLMKTISIYIMFTTALFLGANIHNIIKEQKRTAINF